eukprot:GILI01011098.1.p1 GENE.GILI01011098.1~~GILI01011098.1.p1  ORF type:complete len:177 (+),score=11.52 GILI01011098.1:41-532(+)
MQQQAQPRTQAAPAQRPMGQLNCSHCTVTLAYPLGAPSVRCPLCQNVTQVQQIHVSCVNCRTILLLPANTSVAMCPRCRGIMSIPVNLQRTVMPPGGAGAQPDQGGPPKECIYVERPPVKDKNGIRHSNNIAIGTKLDNDPSASPAPQPQPIQPQSNAGPRRA